MAALYFYLEDNEMKISLQKHKEEKETDPSYLWGKYALELAIQLNFNDFSNYNAHIDQGGAILFLNKDIIKNNDIDLYGYKNTENGDYKLEYFEYDDEESDYESRIYFESQDISSVANALIQDDKYINIMLDLKETTEYIGGFTTPTARATLYIHGALKEYVKIKTSINNSN